MVWHTRRLKTLELAGEKGLEEGEYWWPVLCSSRWMNDLLKIRQFKIELCRVLCEGRRSFCMPEKSFYWKLGQNRIRRLFGEFLEMPYPILCSDKWRAIWICCG